MFLNASRARALPKVSERDCARARRSPLPPPTDQGRLRRQDHPPLSADSQQHLALLVLGWIGLRNSVQGQWRSRRFLHGTLRRMHRNRRRHLAPMRRLFPYPEESLRDDRGGQDPAVQKQHAEQASRRWPDRQGRKAEDRRRTTLSSSRQENELELARASLRALADFPLRVLLTLADPEPGEALRAGAANVRIETFVPHSAVLQRAALCVAHAGHGIVAKAIHFGVPMVLVPWDRDQPGVAARAEALGVARVVERDELTPEALVQAIRNVLETSSYRERAAHHGERVPRLVEG